jgi:hypothetical protein
MRWSLICGEDRNKRAVEPAMSAVTRAFRIKAGTKELVDYDTFAEQPGWMATKKGARGGQNMAGWRNTPNVDGVHDQRVEGDTLQYENTANTDDDAKNKESNGRRKVENVDGQM